MLRGVVEKLLATNGFVMAGRALCTVRRRRADDMVLNSSQGGWRGRGWIIYLRLPTLDTQVSGLGHYGVIELFGGWVSDVRVVVGW